MLFICSSINCPAVPFHCDAIALYAIAVYAIAVYAIAVYAIAVYTIAEYAITVYAMEDSKICREEPKGEEKKK